MSPVKTPKGPARTPKNAARATKGSVNSPKKLTKLPKSLDKTHKQLDYDDRIHAEMLDSFDEELEMEIDDDRMNELVGEATKSGTQQDLDRNFYFKELFRLQGEL